MRPSTAVLALSCVLVTITGYASSKLSPERHAYAFVAYHFDFVGGNFIVNRRGNHRLNLPTSMAMYAHGQQGKATDMSESDVRRIAETIRQQTAQSTRTEHAFTGNANDKQDNTMENKDAVPLGNELSGAYLGGYLGVK